MRRPRPKTCTTCHRGIAAGEWYWVQERPRRFAAIRSTGVTRGVETTCHYYCDEHEPTELP